MLIDLLSPKGEPHLMDVWLVRDHEQDDHEHGCYAPRGRTGMVDGVLFRQGDVQGKSPGEEVDEEEEEERGEDDEELEIIHGVFEDRLVVQVPREGEHEEDDHEEET